MCDTNTINIIAVDHCAWSHPELHQVMHIDSPLLYHTLRVTSAAIKLITDVQLAPLDVALHKL